MVWIFILLSLSVVTPICATPAHFAKRRNCDISSATISGLPSAIAQTSNLKPSWVAVAIGTQNYTCGSSGTYTNVGAVAELTDISCYYGTKFFNPAPDMALAWWNAAPGDVNYQDLVSYGHIMNSKTILGQHYYVPNPTGAAGTNPKWDFSSELLLEDNADAYAIGSKLNSTAAPTGQQDIDWIHLKGIKGGLAQEIYRTDTRLGQPPASCSPGNTVLVKYSAKYWFLGSSVQKP